ncbi:hypothetical protein J1N35_028616 [Gossypium stocksii]|uniref:Uncharacterized protein n=1 Tax=Gossypium stocksii TaxID=47602 RepID=A0A9D3UX16_9ROSI|nr:hypothetical protein J1N35_028616 [Gossypium stocksii]
MDQVHAYEKLVFDILVQGTQMCEILQENVLIEKLSKSWSDYRNFLKYKKRDISSEELISYTKIEEANHLKDKDLFTSKEFHLKVNLVESGSSSNFNRSKRTKNSKKIGKFQNKKAIKFKKPVKNKKSNISMNCYVYSKVGHKAYKCYRHSDR